MGAGMVCLEGTGALSHVSLRNRPEVFHQPCVFAAVGFRGQPELVRVLEGPVPAWRLFGSPGAGNGAAGASYGLPRFRTASFEARFPFGFGASYTQLELGPTSARIEGEELVASAVAANRGDRPGVVVAQLYVEVPGRPMKLAGFARVLLEPGEEQEVVVRVPVERLAIREAGRWVPASGPFRVAFGRHAGDGTPVEVTRPT